MILDKCSINVSPIVADENGDFWNLSPIIDLYNNTVNISRGTVKKFTKEETGSTKDITYFDIEFKKDVPVESLYRTTNNHSPFKELD